MATNEEKIEEAQGLVPDIHNRAEGVCEDLSSAESCETIEDLRSNLENARDAMRDAIKEINEALRILK